MKIRQPQRRSSASSSKSGEDVDRDLVESTAITPDTTKQKTDEDGEKTIAKKLYDLFLEVVDWVIEQLEQGSSLYREVVFSIKEPASPTHERGEKEPIAMHRPRYGSTEEAAAQPAAAAPHTEITVVEVHEGEPKPDDEQPETDKPVAKPKTEKQRGKKKKKKNAKSVDFASDTLIEELHIEPSKSERQEIEQFEGELGETAMKVTSRLRRLSAAIYYYLLAHSDYPVLFFIILNITLNGSVLSLVYAILLYTWGLLSIPWPTRKFWLTLIFYTMSVLLVKYAFQFRDISYWRENFNAAGGLYPPQILGIQHRKNFFTNAVWDILLLIALLLHRGLLVQYGLWNTSVRQNIVKSFTNFL